MQLFSIDYRSLALFRIGLSLVMLYCLSSFAVVADAFLIEDGVMTSSGLTESHFRGSWAWSLNWLSGAAWYQYSLLVIGALAAGLLLIGWKTRWATIASWVIVTSLLNAAPPIIGGGDILLNVLLFWAIFLPLGARWSVDSRSQPQPPQQSLVSMATAGVMLQMAIMYLFTGLSKCNEVWYCGEALDIGLSNARLVRPLGNILSEYPWLTHSLTWATLVGELVLPFIIFSPWKPRLCRSLALLAFIAFHLGIESTMVVMLFSFSSLAGLTVFIPTFWWDHVPLRPLANLFDRFIPKETNGEETEKRRKKKQRRFQLQKDEGNLRGRFLRGFLIVCLLYVLFYNVLVEFASPEMRESMGSYQRFGELLALKQYWNMFSDPSPLCHEVACVAMLRDRTQIDLLRNNEEVEDRFQRPEQPLNYDKTRLMIFTTALTYPENKVHRKPFTDYLCRTYSERPHDQEKDIMECRLMYYLFGAHPRASTHPYVQIVGIGYPNGL